MIKRLTGFVAALCIALLGAIAPSAATDGAGLSPVAYNYDAQDVASLIANTTFERGPPARTYAQTALGAVDQSDGTSARPEVAEGHGYTTYDDAALPAHIASAMGTTRGPAPVASGDFMALQCTRVAAKTGDDAVRLFRNVDATEFDAIAGTGRFTTGPGMMEGKWFATSGEHAEQWGAKLNGGQGLTVETRIPRSVADQLHHEAGKLDGIGPGWYADGGGLDAINRFMDGIRVWP